MARKVSTKQSTKRAKSLSQAPKRMVGQAGNSLLKFLSKATGPVRKTKVWRFLRRTVLRSPFRGYFVDSWKELRQVTWPKRATAWRLTFTVILFAVIFAGIVTALDYGFENLAKRIFLQ